MTTTSDRPGFHTVQPSTTSAVFSSIPKARSNWSIILHRKVQRGWTKPVVRNRQTRGRVAESPSRRVAEQPIDGASHARYVRRVAVAATIRVGVAENHPRFTRLPSSLSRTSAATPPRSTSPTECVTSSRRRSAKYRRSRSRRARRRMLFAAKRVSHRATSGASSASTQSSRAPSDAPATSFASRRSSPVRPPD
jgi:hypothetical protein